jgi:hypothetical protein
MGKKKKQNTIQYFEKIKNKNPTNIGSSISIFRV